LDSISIVIPAYNEEARLPATLTSVTGYLRSRANTFAEVVVVDDGSSDGTAEVVERFGAEHTEVRLLRNPGNRGKGYSVRHGVLEARGEWVLFSDADLSAPIEELDTLAAAARERQASIVIGSRAINRKLIGVHQSYFRENAGRVFNLCMRLLVGLPFWDTQCGFKLFDKRAAREIFRRQRIDRFGFDAEVLLIGRRLGFRTIEVPVHWNHVEGTKVSMFRDSVNMFLDLLRIRWYQIRGYYT
jgi:glycosyltransferase involved in cell wall biosynthesis